MKRPKPDSLFERIHDLPRPTPADTAKWILGAVHSDWQAPFDQFMQAAELAALALAEAGELPVPQAEAYAKELQRQIATARRCFASLRAAGADMSDAVGLAVTMAGLGITLTQAIADTEHAPAVDSRRRSDRGLKKNPNSHPPKIDDDEFARLEPLTRSDAELARKLKVTPSAISQHRDRTGRRPPNRPEKR